MLERHHDYIYTLTSIANGQIIEAMVQPTDSDAPFILRALGGYSITAAGTSGEAVANLPALLMLRFADADNNWLQTARTPGLLAQTSPTNYIPMRRHMTYPAQASIRFQLENLSGAELTNVVIVFRGVKLFAGGYGQPSPVYAPTYPAPPRCPVTETFQYVVNFSLAAGTEQLNTPINVNGDADFAWRGNLAVRDVSVASSSLETLEVRVRDVWGKGYSSDGVGGGLGAWVRVQRLFGAVPSAPGLWYPELYIERGQQFTVDLRNVGVGLTTAGQLALDGVKVFTR